MYSGVDKSKTEFRRKWDLEEFERKAQERLGKRKKIEKDDDNDDNASDAGSGSDNDVKKDKKKKDDKPKKPKELLQARDYKVDLESRVGKSVVINRAGSSSGGGYFCEICDCTLKDSVSYLDHINGKKHQQNLGFSMKVKRSTIDDVKARFQFNLNKKEEEKKTYDLEEKMRELKEEEERLKEYRREKKKEKKNKKNKRRKTDEDDDDDDGQCLDDEMAAFMGFGSFGSSQKK